MNVPVQPVGPISKCFRSEINKTIERLEARG